MILVKYLFQILMIKTVDESHSARVLIGCKTKPIRTLKCEIQSVKSRDNFQASELVKVSLWFIFCGQLIEYDF